MYESFRTRSCVSPRMARKQAFAVAHTLLSLMASLCLACAARSEGGAPCPVIEMGAVVDTQTDSSKAVTLNDGTTVLMSRTALVTTGDITGATASKDNDQWVLDFTVTDGAAKRVNEFSGRHIGTRLVSLVDGKVSGGSPRIIGAILTNRYQIDGLNQADAERLATALSNGCRR